MKGGKLFKQLNLYFFRDIHALCGYRAVEGLASLQRIHQVRLSYKVPADVLIFSHFANLKKLFKTLTSHFKLVCQEN